MSQIAFMFLPVYHSIENKTVMLNVLMKLRTKYTKFYIINYNLICFYEYKKFITRVQQNILV
jgi:hypothetical protein